MPNFILVTLQSNCHVQLVGVILVIVRNRGADDLDELLVLDVAVDVDVGLAEDLVDWKNIFKMLSTAPRKQFTELSCTDQHHVLGMAPE